MISLKEIQRHYSEKERIFPRMMIKEYLQYKILNSIFSSCYGDRLVFMGGTAVRMVYGGDRFSEDLDLDNMLSTKEFIALTDHIAKELRRDGISIEFRNTFRDMYHCYLKFPYILFDNRLSPLRDEKVVIRLDSFHTDNLFQAEACALSKADVFSEIRVYSHDIILAQKIEALFNRKRAKGRDVYDIVYLFSLGEPNYKYLIRVLNIHNKEELVNRMGVLFTDTQLHSLGRDVQPFLIDSGKIRQVEKFNVWMKSI